ncbi:hypothetical protein [uncultured Alsobacter sp.]|uniref:hypothetical protein n=1 Tax=uncultured Alsobacter sp. TaxID=1748258 RepID=UPI0025E2C855|nr:hypothetical protein [uncultured Alsobacter sp.]
MTAKHDESSIQDGCRKLVQNEVGNCLSMLVHTLANAYGATVANGPGNDLGDLCEQAMELSTPIPDYEEAARDAGWKSADMTPGMLVNDKLVDEDTGRAESFEGSWQELCEEYRIEPHEREIYEHWAVSSWLADKLESRGERIDRDFAGLIVWGRTTTGQAILLDGVIRDIYRELHGIAGGE